MVRKIKLGWERDTFDRNGCGEFMLLPDFREKYLSKTNVDVELGGGIVRQTDLYVRAFKNYCGRYPNYADSHRRVNIARMMMNFKKFDLDETSLERMRAWNGKSEV